MQTIQAIRGLSQQPPQRIDVDNNTVSPTSQQPDNKENTLINDGNKKQDMVPMDVDITTAYKRKELKYEVECGVAVQTGSDDIETLKAMLGVRKCQMFKNDQAMTRCVVCDEHCVSGEFAVETVLFIPNKNDPKYGDLRRFRIELPRIACPECAAEYASDNNITPSKSTLVSALSKIWQTYQATNTKSMTTTSNNQQSGARSIASGGPAIAGGVQMDDDSKSMAQQMAQMNMNDVMGSDPQQRGGGHSMHGMQPQSMQNKGALPLSEAERDPFDDGFLICTQLVKTGGADQGGLQVGDVFVEFGHYSKKRFPGLKSIANLVRRSAGKEINVVVWRKLEQCNGVEDDSGKTVFQKLALKLKPLQSHDADGGGVLGAVINTYPLPEMKN